MDLLEQLEVAIDLERSVARLNVAPRNFSELTLIAEIEKAIVFCSTAFNNADAERPPRGMKTWEITWILFNAQAACVFSCSASKRSSFFQSVKVIAAILRASVRRAISGFIPLASKAA